MKLAGQSVPQNQNLEKSWKKKEEKKTESVHLIASSA